MRSSRLRVAFAASLLSLAAPSAEARAEDLSSQQAIARAARQSPSLRATLHDIEAARHAVAAERGARDPIFSASAQGQYAESFGASVNGVSQNTNESLASRAALSYTTDVGTSLEVGIETNVGWRTSNITAATTQTVTVGPNYNASLYLTGRQPLLRGAGTDANTAAIRAAEASVSSADEQRNTTASQAALDVMTAYWELWYAESAVGVQEQALATAERQLAESRQRVEQLGIGARVDTLQFATSVASIQDALSQARATRATRAIELGRLLGMQPAESATLRAVEPPPEGDGGEPGAGPLAERLLTRSPELAAARADLAASEARFESTLDGDQPRLDLFATVSMNGTWVDDSLPGLDLPGDRPAFTALGGVELELPLGGGRAAGQAAQARAQLQAARARYQAQVDAIQATASSLSENLRASREQVRLAAETARIARELAEAERQRLILGTGQPVDVVRAEQTHREAELRRLRAVVDQAARKLSLEHAMGALLDRVGAAFAGRPS